MMATVALASLASLALTLATLAIAHPTHWIELNPSAAGYPVSSWLATAAKAVVLTIGLTALARLWPRTFPWLANGALAALATLCCLDAAWDAAQLLTLLRLPVTR